MKFSCFINSIGNFFVCKIVNESCMSFKACSIFIYIYIYIYKFWYWKRHKYTNAKNKYDEKKGQCCLGYINNKIKEKNKANMDTNRAYTSAACFLYSEDFLFFLFWYYKKATPPCNFKVNKKK